MFENMASEAVQVLTILFWFTLAVIVISGALWVKSVKKSK